MTQFTGLIVDTELLIWSGVHMNKEGRETLVQIVAADT